MAKIFANEASREGFITTEGASYDKSLDRIAGQPLDKKEVWDDLEKLKAYAKSVYAYVGQKVAYIDGNKKVKHFSIDADGELKPLGGNVAFFTSLAAANNAITTENTDIYGEKDYYYGQDVIIYSADTNLDTHYVISKTDNGVELRFRAERNVAETSKEVGNGINDQYLIKYYEKDNNLQLKNVSSEFTTEIKLSRNDINVNRYPLDSVETLMTEYSTNRDFAFLKEVITDGLPAAGNGIPLGLTDTTQIELADGTIYNFNIVTRKFYNGDTEVDIESEFISGETKITVYNDKNEPSVYTYYKLEKGTYIAKPKEGEEGNNHTFNNILINPIAAYDDSTLHIPLFKDGADSYAFMLDEISETIPVKAVIINGTGFVYKGLHAAVDITYEPNKAKCFEYSDCIYGVVYDNNVPVSAIRLGSKNTNSSKDLNQAYNPYRIDIYDIGFEKPFCLNGVHEGIFKKVGDKYFYVYIRHVGSHLEKYRDCTNIYNNKTNVYITGTTYKDFIFNTDEEKVFYGNFDSYSLISALEGKSHVSTLDKFVDLRYIDFGSSVWSDDAPNGGYSSSSQVDPSLFVKGTKEIEINTRTVQSLINDVITISLTDNNWYLNSSGGIATYSVTAMIEDTAVPVITNVECKLTGCGAKTAKIEVPLTEELTRNGYNKTMVTKIIIKQVLSANAYGWGGTTTFNAQIYKPKTTFGTFDYLEYYNREGMQDMYVNQPKLYPVGNYIFTETTGAEARLVPFEKYNGEVEKLPLINICIKGFEFPLSEQYVWGNTHPSWSAERNKYFVQYLFGQHRDTGKTYVLWRDLVVGFRNANGSVTTIRQPWSNFKEFMPIIETQELQDQINTLQTQLTSLEERLVALEAHHAEE